MDRLHWSSSEKRIARRAFEEALERTLSQCVADFKARAANAATAADVWAIADDLHRQRRELDALFDYRYSQLLVVFAGLIARGLLDAERLRGLSEEKLEAIRGIMRGLANWPRA